MSKLYFYKFGLKYNLKQVLIVNIKNLNSNNCRFFNETLEEKIDHRLFEE